MRLFVVDEIEKSRQCVAERKLWCEVLSQAVLSASKGDRSAVLFFTATNGRFVELCELLDLNAENIRKQILVLRKDVTK